MAGAANGSEALLEDIEEFRPIGEIEDADRRRRKDLDRESARAVKGGATRGEASTTDALQSYMKLMMCLSWRAIALGVPSHVASHAAKVLLHPH